MQTKWLPGFCIDMNSDLKFQNQRRANDAVRYDSVWRAVGFCGVTRRYTIH